MSVPAFLAAPYAWLALLAIPLIIFYFLKLRRPQMRVPSLVLWQQVINDQRVNSPFQKFKKNLLLLLQLLLLAMLILAAMQPFWPQQAERARYLPVLIDASASMAARDSATGRTRLELAKEQVSQLIDDLMADQQVAIIAVTSTGQRVTSFTDNKRMLRDALQQIETHDVPSSLEDALRMAQAMSRSVPIESVLLYTDGNVPEQIDFELPFDVNYQAIGKPESNLGVTALSARRAAARRWQVFLRVDAADGAGGGAKAQLLQDGQVIAEEFVSVDSSDSARVSFTIDTEREVSLEARLIPEGADALEADNRAYLQLPAPRSLRVYCPPALETFRHALRGIADVDLYPMTDGRTPPSVLDLWIGDTEFPQDDFDARVRLVVGHVPAAVAHLLELQQGSAEVIDWQRSSPVLQYVQLTDVICTEDIVQKTGVQHQDFEQLGFEVLVDGRRGPLMLREVGRAYDAYHLLFHPDRSTFIYRVGFPVFVNNLVQSAQRAASLLEIDAGHTGLLASRELEPGAGYQVELPSGQSSSVTTNADGRLLGVAAPQVGPYVIRKDGDVVANAGASLLDTMETKLESRKELQFREASVSVADEKLAQDHPLWPWFAWAAFALLLFEWWYFHRRQGAVAVQSIGQSARANAGRAALRRSAGCLLSVLAVLAGSSTAADPLMLGELEKHGLRAEYDMTSSKNRYQSPYLVVWKVEWEKDFILEGHFHIEFYRDRVKYQTYDTSDYVISKGDRILRMLLPTAGGPRHWMEHYMLVTFVGKDREYPLGRHDISIQSERHLCGFCHVTSPPTSVAAARENEIARNLRFEKVLEGSQELRTMSWLPNTMVTSWESQDLPLSPMYYTAFDLVQLGSGALAAASPNQLQALETWVRAGGRIVVCLGETLRPHQEAFVNRLLEPGGAESASDEEPGVPLWERRGPPQGMWTLRSGLGRVVIVPAAAPHAESEPSLDLEDMHHFIWGFPRETVTRTQSAEEQLMEGRTRNIWNRNRPKDVPRRVNDFDAVFSRLRDVLVPSDVKMIPTGVTGLILWGYLMLVGPVDYFVLRLFRLQRWTWITFPLVTLLVSLFCLRISDHYLSSDHEGRTLIVRDVDAEGRCYVEHQFRMVFSARRAVTTDEVRDTVLVMLPAETILGGQFSVYQTTDDDLQVISGSVPSQYQLTRTVERWSPRVDRLLFLGRASDDPEGDEPQRTRPDVAQAIRELITAPAPPIRDTLDDPLAVEGLSSESDFGIVLGEGEDQGQGEGEGLPLGMPSEDKQSFETESAPAPDPVEVFRRVRELLGNETAHAVLRGGPDCLTDNAVTYRESLGHDATYLDAYNISSGYGYGPGNAVIPGYTGQTPPDWARTGSHDLNPYEILKVMRSVSVYSSWSKPLEAGRTRDLFTYWDLPVAPHGGADFQDLALMDADDPRHGVAILVVPQDDDVVVVYRHHFIGDGESR